MRVQGEGRPDPNAMLVDTERVYEYDTYRDLGTLSSSSVLRSQAGSKPEI